MKIQAGIRNWDDFYYFTENGAEEVYCAIAGIPSHCYRGKDFETEGEIIKAVNLAHKKNIDFFLVANEVQSEYFEKTLETVKNLIAEGIDGVILRDMGALEEFKKMGIRTDYILTSLSLCFNEKSLEFYKKKGITRLALPEQLLPEEAEKIVRNNLGIKTEVFLCAREYCVVLNGFCYLTAFNGECICEKPFKCGGEYFFMPKPSDEEHFSNLYDFYKLGVEVLKVGRHPEASYSRAVFSEAVAVKKLLDAGLPKGKFIKKALEIHSKVGGILKKCPKKK